MGDIAEDIISGKQCSECGICFEKACGFQVLCKRCWTQYSNLPKAIFKEL
jgi:hypothetical protein